VGGRGTARDLRLISDKQTRSDRHPQQLEGERYLRGADQESATRPPIERRSCASMFCTDDRMGTAGGRAVFGGTKSPEPGGAFATMNASMFVHRDTNGIVPEEDTVALADVGLGELIWTTLLIFVLVMFLWVFILAVRHLFRDRELSGWAKAGWLLGLILFPLLGSLVYLVVRGGWVTEESAADSAARAQLTRTEFDRRSGSVADSTGDRSDGRPEPTGRAAE
jgi:Phospholipase_D-nuclease N-terminal